MNEQLSLPFDINRPPGAGEKVARLPSPGLLGGEAFAYIKDPQTYVAAIHASLGDNPGAPVPSSLDIAAKAMGIQVPQAYSYANFSFMPDAGNWGLMQWPGVNPNSLMKVCRENILPRMVIEARSGDMGRYSGRSSKLWEPGWSIGLMDAKATPTKKDRQDMRDAESFLFNGSRDFNYQDARERDGALLTPFDMLLRQFADDIHTFDGWALWTQSDRLGRPIAFANLPAGLIRLAMPGHGIKNDPRLFAALIDQTGNPVKMFTRRELTWSVMNPRTDPAAMGYGFPIPEMGMRLVQAFQAAVDLNSDTFTRNGIPNGMLLLKGDYFSQENIDALTREWTNMKRGVSKLWGFPVMSVPDQGDVELLNFMDLKGQDVRYKDHMQMMAGLYCFISQFPIRRTGLFASGSNKDNQPVPDEATEIQGVDDPGLPGHLTFLEQRINPYLIWPTWPHLKFGFLNKDPKSDARSYEARAKARTWKEARAEADLPELTSIVPAEMKPIAEIMEMCPEDSGKMGVFQTLANTMLEAKLGVSDNKDQERVGAPHGEKIDPAQSQSHGHRAGVRRDSAAESAV